MTLQFVFLHILIAVNRSMTSGQEGTNLPSLDLMFDVICLQEVSFSLGYYFVIISIKKQQRTHYY